MDAVYESFSIRLISTDDYEESSKYSNNEFLFQREQTIAYRRKLDKLLFGLFVLTLDIVLRFKRRQIKRVSSSIGKKVSANKLAKQYIFIDKLRMTALLLALTDVFFYCGHQILHQKVSNISSNFEFLATYILSVFIFTYLMFAYVELYYTLSVIEKTRVKRYLKAQKKKFLQMKKSKVIDQPAKEQKQESESSKKNKSDLLDFNKTIKGDHYVELIVLDQSNLSLATSSNAYSISFITRI
jgi:hypothetical protein